jgi:hypothetical protein
MKTTESITAGKTEGGLIYLIIGMEERGTQAPILILNEEETWRVIASLEMALTGNIFTHDKADA